MTGTAQVTLRFAKQYLEPGEVALGKMPESHSFRVETEGGEKTRLQRGAGKSYLGFSIESGKRASSRIWMTRWWFQRFFPGIQTTGPQTTHVPLVEI